MSESTTAAVYRTAEQGVVPVDVLCDAGQVRLGHASAALNLLTRAYAHQFEEPRGSLPAGTFAQHFDAGRAHQQLSRMNRYIQNGAQYWFIPDDGPFQATWAWRGLAKISPSRADRLQRLGLKSPNGYLNDIVVDPAEQSQGNGSILLHAALTQSGLDHTRSLTLDAFEENVTTNVWFRRLGMHATSAEVPPLSLNGGAQELSQVRYTSDGRVSMGDIALRLLEAKQLVVGPAEA
jgi:hypothetical protein